MGGLGPHGNVSIVGADQTCMTRLLTSGKLAGFQVSLKSQIGKGETGSLVSV